MASPTPEVLLQRILGPSVAEALTRTGTSAAPLAKSALLAWCSALPTGYSGPAPDGSPFAKSEVLVERCGLAKTETLPIKLDAAVAALVRLGQERANQAVRLAALSKTAKMSIDPHERIAHVNHPSGNYRVRVSGSSAVWERQNLSRDGKKIVWKPAETGKWDEHHGFYGGYPNISYDQLTAAEAAIKGGGSTQKSEPRSDTFHDLRARATTLGQNARRTDVQKDHREAALHFRKAADVAKQQGRTNDAGYLEGEASFHESRALNAPSAPKRPTKKAEPTPPAAPDKGAAAEPRGATPPEPPQKAPPTVKPPRQAPNKATIELTKAEACRARCRRCGLAYFELGKAEPQFTGCLCCSELAKSATVRVAGDRLSLELAAEPQKVQRLAGELKKTVSYPENMEKARKPIQDQFFDLGSQEAKEFRGHYGNVQRMKDLAAKIRAVHAEHGATLAGSPSGQRMRAKSAADEVLQPAYDFLQGVTATPSHRMQQLAAGVWIHRDRARQALADHAAARADLDDARKQLKDLRWPKTQ